MDKAWKRRERVIAKDYGCERNALSGGNSKLSRSDSTSRHIFIEAKGRKNHAAIKLYDDTKILAAKEKKIPLLALWQPNRHGYLLVLDPRHLKEVAELYTGDNTWQEEQAGLNTQPLSDRTTTT